MLINSEKFRKLKKKKHNCRQIFRNSKSATDLPSVSSFTFVSSSIYCSTFLYLREGIRSGQKNYTCINYTLVLSYLCLHRGTVNH